MPCHTIPCHTTVVIKNASFSVSRWQIFCISTANGDTQKLLNAILFVTIELCQYMYLGSLSSCIFQNGCLHTNVAHSNVFMHVPVGIIDGKRHCNLALFLHELYVCMRYSRKSCHCLHKLGGSSHLHICSIEWSVFGHINCGSVEGKSCRLS